MKIKSMQDTVKTNFDPLVASARNFFSKPEIFLNYFKKQIQEQGISFLIGIAVGVNLTLLLQMSPDILNMLSGPTTGSLLGIASISSTIVVGITIFCMQQKADSKINEFNKE